MLACDTAQEGGSLVAMTQTDTMMALRKRYYELKSGRDRARKALVACPDDVFCRNAYERLVIETNQAYVQWLESTWKSPFLR